MDRFEAQLVDYISKHTYERLTKEAVRAVKERLLDSFACALAGFSETPVKAARAIAMQTSSARGATVFGTRHLAPMEGATLALGTAVRALDWNDTYLSKEPAHPSDNIAAAYSVAEAEKKNGRDLIAAVALAYEMQCRFCDAAGIRKKGWDHVTYASVSSTAAAAWLMGLPPAQIRDAIAIAVTTGNYLRQTRIGTISNWKAAAFAKAAKNAVEAALCVRNGFTGPSEIFTGQHGLINQITQGEFDLAGKFGGQGGEEFKIVGTYIKYFPAEYHSQSAIWAALDLREKIGKERIGAISSILVETCHHSYEIIGMDPDKWRPTTKETADHSLPFITAAALTDGEITPKQFDQEHLDDPALLALVRKVKVREKREYTEIYGTSFPNKLTVTLDDGRIFEKEVKDPKGHPRNPLARSEIEAKFKRAAEGLLSSRQQARAVEIVWDLENAKDLRELSDCFAVT
ncbi:MAG: MmgE/PrpD family protein [Pseudomonadota bacterium]